MYEAEDHTLQNSTPINHQIYLQVSIKKSHSVHIEDQPHRTPCNNQIIGNKRKTESLNARLYTWIIPGKHIT